MSQAIEFTVFGQAIPQGSKIPQLIRRKGGAPVLKDGRAIVVTRDDNPGLKGWRNTVAYCARQAYSGDLLRGPVALLARFYVPHPKGHFGTGRNADTLKGSAPKWPVTWTDADKLFRAVGDALTQVIYADDKQICDLRAVKLYGEPARVEVRIEALEEAEQGTRLIDLNF